MQENIPIGKFARISPKLALKLPERDIVVDTEARLGSVMASPLTRMRLKGVPGQTLMKKQPVALVEYA